MKKSAGFLLLLLVIGGCVNSLDNSEDAAEELPRSLTAAEEELILSSQDFSYDLFNRINNDTHQENIIISPFSLFVALGVPLTGAFGETRDEIQEMLHLSGMNLEEVNEACESLCELILSLDAEADMQLVTALWHREGLSVKEDFTETARRYFDSDVLELDPEESDAADIINEWVEERTEGHIGRIVDFVPRFMILYLTDAAYFQDAWRHSFDADLTRLGLFYSEGGDTLDVEMMEQEAEMAAYLSEEVQMVDLPFGDGYFSMTLMMPGEPEQSVSEFINEYMTEDRLAEWLNEMTTRGTLVQIPKFEAEGEYNLRGIFENMGMRNAFDRSADFYNINEEDRVYLSELRHKTVVRITEEGRKKARRVSSGRSVRFNRPFVFLIREQHSGLILFMSKIGNPAGGEGQSFK